MPTSHDLTVSHGLTVRPVVTRRDRRRFIDLPYRLYEDNRHWVPPLRRDVKQTLDPSRNAFFEHGQIQPFVAEAGGRVVGRIAAVVNGMHLATHDDGAGFFGFFECEERYDAAEALLGAAGRWLAQQNLTSMRGPANPSLNDTAGLLVDGFDRRPSLLMPYNPPYYHAYLQRAGFARVMTMWAYYVHARYVEADRLRRGAALVHRRTPGLSVRTLDMDRLDAEAQLVLDIYNDAWAANWGFVPMTPAELDQLIAELKQIVDPRLVFFVEHEGEAVAFSVTLPDLNQALVHVEDGRLFPLGLPKLLAYATFGIYDTRMPLMGVRQAYHGKGLDSLLILSTIEDGRAAGYTGCEMSWVLDTNDRLKNALPRMGAVIDKEYALFERPLG